MSKAGCPICPCAALQLKSIAIQAFSTLPVESRRFFSILYSRHMPVEWRVLSSLGRNRKVTFQAVVDRGVSYHPNCFPNTMRALPSKAVFLSIRPSEKVGFVSKNLAAHMYILWLSSSNEMSFAESLDS